MDINKLIILCNMFTVEVCFNGFMPFKHDVIDAELLLEQLHTTSDIDKDEFIANINAENFMTPEYESIFKSIKTQGVFKVIGHEALSGNAYIECKELNWL